MHISTTLSKDNMLSICLEIFTCYINTVPYIHRYHKTEQFIKNFSYSTSQLLFTKDKHTCCLAGLKSLLMMLSQKH